MEFFSEIIMALIFASFSFRTGSLIQQILQYVGPLDCRAINYFWSYQASASLCDFYYYVDTTGLWQKMVTTAS